MRGSSTVTKYIILPLLLLTIMGVSVAGSLVSATWSITNESGSQSVNSPPFGYPVKVSTEALFSSDIIGSDGLNWETVNGVSDEVPFAPSPMDAFIEACGLGVASDTTDCTDVGTADVEIFTATGSDLTAGTDFVFGGDFQFTRLEIHIDTAGVFATDPDIIWEYCTAESGGACTIWTALPGLVDDTSGFTEVGIKSVAWDFIPLWVESIDVTGLTSFYVRARVVTTVTNANYTTQALADQVRYDLGYAMFFPCSPCDDTDSSFDFLNLGIGESFQAFSHLGGTAARTNHNMVAGDAGLQHSSFSQPNNDDFVLELTASLDYRSTASARRLFIDADSSDFIELDMSVSISHLVVDIGDCDFDVPTFVFDDEMHVITLVYENGVQCELFLDGVSEGVDASVSGSVLFVAPVSFFEDKSANYFESVELENDTLVLTGAPDILIEIGANDLAVYQPTAFINQGSGGGFATPSFPLWQTGLLGASTPFLPATVVTSSDISQQPDLIGEFANVELVPTPGAVTLPGNEAITELTGLDSVGIPPDGVYKLLGLLLAFVVLIAVFKATGNIIMTMIAVGAVLSLFVALGVFGLWQVFVFAVIGAAIVLIGRGIVSSV